VAAAASDIGRALTIELSDTTLRFDRDVKAPLYARHGVPETWILDLRANRLLRFRRSTAARDPIAAQGDFARTSIDTLPGIAIDLAPLRDASA
jgi:Uma2 family endonuclease